MVIGTSLHQITRGPRALTVLSSVLSSCRLLIPGACLYTILYLLHFLCLYHPFNFETHVHVGLCPRLLTFSLDKFASSPTHSCDEATVLTCWFINLRASWSV